ncbi:MAG: hypothetical protein AAGA58_05885 [Verrucomicrobiota bacterium]
MIALPNQLPLLQFGDHEVVQYEHRWLKDSITEAAQKAGHNDWCFANEIAQAVIEYLRERFHGSVITIDDLYEKIERVLSHLGWRDIACELEAAPPPLRISLYEIACSAENGYELQFFESLKRRLRNTTSAAPRQIVVCDMKKAVKHLCGVQRWTNRCDYLRHEIVTFVRREICDNMRKSRRQFGLVLH